MDALGATNKANGCQPKTPDIQAVACGLFDSWVVC